MPHPKIRDFLVDRGISNEDHDAFLQPAYDRDIHDPFLFDDMERAVQRIARAISDTEQIVVYGDYDVDGVSGAVILHDVLSKAGARVSLFFNHREDDGYGLHHQCIDRISADTAPGLMITTDCGIANSDEVAYARSKGIDTIITDHHTPPQTDDDLPLAYAIIHPRVHADRYPWKHLSGGGSAFKLAQALCRTYARSDSSWLQEEKWLLDLVALSTLSDCVPLQGENRALMHYGFKVIPKTRRPGLRVLLARVPSFYQSSLTNALQFYVIPLLNAASRMEHASYAAELLLARDEKSAEEAADALVRMNAERQRLTQKTVRAIPGNIIINENVLLAASSHWRLGVLGLVANKLVSTYRKPVILIREGSPHVGVARSTPTVDIARTFSLLSHCFDRYGGHRAAGGFTLKGSLSLESFAEELERIDPVMISEEHPPNQHPEMRLAELTGDYMQDLRACEPWGPGNPKPAFLFKDCIVHDIIPIGTRHQWSRLRIEQDGSRMSVRIKSALAESVALAISQCVDITCEIGIREWRGQSEIELCARSIGKEFAHV